ncbi:MAG: AEC family transporter, partial [Evtepia sp.]
ILGSVPLFNLYAVLVLTLEGPHAKDGSFPTRLKLATINIAKNPIIWGILLGTIPAFLGITSFPPILDKTLSSLSSLTTPLALLSIGTTLHLKNLFSNFRLSATASALKLFILPALFLPLAIYFGFTGAKLMALIIMLGGTATPTCYVMAKNLGHQGLLSANVIIMTTVLSAFTLTFWIFFMRYLGYLT